MPTDRARLSQLLETEFSDITPIIASARLNAPIALRGFSTEELLPIDIRHPLSPYHGDSMRALDRIKATDDAYGYALRSRVALRSAADGVIAPNEAERYLRGFIERAEGSIEADEARRYLGRVGDVAAIVHEIDTHLDPHMGWLRVLAENAFVKDPLVIALDEFMHYTENRADVLRDRRAA